MQGIFGVKAQTKAQSDPKPARERIMRAAMQAFMELGYAEASTLEIATRAQVSKRELYALFGSKQAMLAACVTDRAQRMRMTADLPRARSREMLAMVLSKLGATILREVTDPVVMGVFRLAITEAQRAPEVARTLETAREAVRATLCNVVTQAQVDGLLAAGDPAEIAGRYLGLLWGDLMVGVLLRIREAPGPQEAERRARDAATDLLRLYPEPPAAT
ncbi:MAG TPA: TetR/AcrR family transcriptional regulator [Steroidobacteraceae bacterium]|jgi:AcrR family transcriptional regulator|nr:TetR/AcrR family transcriptional regulator [Steroidobacteraceae bacterium]